MVHFASSRLSAVALGRRRSSLAFAVNKESIDLAGQPLQMFYCCTAISSVTSAAGYDNVLGRTDPLEGDGTSTQHICVLIADDASNGSGHEGIYSWESETDAVAIGATIT